jgi:hypothetical protein
MAENELIGPPRRLPAMERKIADIGKGDVRVRLTGTVLDRKGSSLVIDDGSGQIQATFTEPVTAEISQLVRVFGKVIPMEEGFELQGEAIQDMSKLDMQLYKKVHEMEREMI